MSAPADSSVRPEPADLPYQSLYRRFRPQSFGEVRGQEHVTNTLRNAVATERVAHAYLFSGPRGTGKTSTARILAKALNCTESEGGEPCGHCASCTAITAGSSFDVHELDAASNNGVDAMRDLVARASLATPGRWKVYIVDEVHMLSTAASNALLKTLEEPPDHVVFVLATTDPQKVLLTIRSRTQHFEFHLLNEDVLESLLDDVAARAALSLPDGAIAVASRRGRGSARDALSVLDQVNTAGIVEDDSDFLARIIDALAGSSTAGALTALDATLHNGRDPHQVATELVERLRAGFLKMVAPDVRTIATDMTAQATTEVESLGAARCVRAMELFGGTIVAMRDAPDPRITLEVCLIRLTHPEAEDSPQSIVDRLERLERRLEGTAGGTTTTTVRVEPGPSSGPNDVRPTEAAEPPKRTAAQMGARPALGAFRAARPTSSSPSAPSEQTPSAVGQAETTSPTSSAPDTASVTAPSSDAPTELAPMPTRDAIVTAWGDRLLVALRPKVRAIYQAGRFVGVEDGQAVLALPNTAHIAHAEPLRKEVEETLGHHFGRPVGLKLVPEGPSERPTAPDDALDETPVAPTAVQAISPIEIAEDDEGEVGEGTEAPQFGLAWAEGQLLQAFPGAEEVRP